MATENNVNDLPLPKKNPLSLQIDLSKFEKASEEEKKQQEPSGTPSQAAKT